MFVVRFTAEEMACRCKWWWWGARGVVKLYLLFFTARVSCVTAGGHMLLKVHGNKRARLRR